MRTATALASLLALSSATSSIAASSTTFATSTVGMTAVTTDSSPLEIAAVEVDTQGFTEGPPNVYDHDYNENEKKHILDCSYTRPTCLCEYEIGIFRYNAMRCDSLRWKWVAACYNTPGVWDFCKGGAEYGPPGRTHAPPSPPPLPKMTKNCWMDGIPPDDCETRKMHLPTARA
jgi:hypothetical protein